MHPCPMGTPLSLQLGEQHGAAHFQLLEGNFRKVKNELLDFVMKCFLAALLTVS